MTGIYNNTQVRTKTKNQQGNDQSRTSVAEKEVFLIYQIVFPRNNMV